jgi:rRNA maturation protein Nop10
MPRGIYERKKKPTRMGPMYHSRRKETTTQQDRELMQKMQQAAEDLNTKKCPECHHEMVNDKCFKCGFFVERLPPTTYDPRAPFWRRWTKTHKGTE